METVIQIILLYYASPYEREKMDKEDRGACK